MEKRGAGISYPMPNIKTAHLVSAADAGAHAGYGCRRNTDTTDRPLGSFFDFIILLRPSMAPWASPFLLIIKIEYRTHLSSYVKSLLTQSQHATIEAGQHHVVQPMERQFRLLGAVPEEEAGWGRVL